MDEGTIIYIVIAVIAFIVSVLRKKKQQNAAIQTIQNVEPESEFSMEEFFKEKSRVFPSQETELEIIDPKEPVAKKEKVIHKPLIMDDNIYEKNKIKDAEELEWNFPDTKTENSIEFNLRDAVIYSEIMNRKEY